MNSWERLQEILNDVSGRGRLGTEKHKPTEEEFTSWFEEAELRKPHPSREAIIMRIKARNSYRWWRLQHDYKWLKRQCKKMGLNPEEARELL